MDNLKYLGNIMRKEIVHQPQSNAESKRRSLNGKDLHFFFFANEEGREGKKWKSRIPFFETPWTELLEFSRQAYWSGLPFPLKGIFPIQGSKLSLLHCRQNLYHLSHQGRLQGEDEAILRKEWLTKCSCRGPRKQLREKEKDTLSSELEGRG